MSDLYLMNQSGDFEYICLDITLGHDAESDLGFVDLDLIFKVTAGLKLPILSQKVPFSTISYDLVGGF